MTGWTKRRVLAAFLLFGSGVAATLLVLMVGSMVFAGSRAQLVPAHDMSNYAIEMEPESDELVLDDRFAMAEEASGAPGRSEGGGSLKIIQGSTNEPSRSQTKEAEKKQGLSKEEGGQYRTWRWGFGTTTLASTGAPPRPVSSVAWRFAFFARY